jgi:hypothetical protein
MSKLKIRGIGRTGIHKIIRIVTAVFIIALVPIISLLIQSCGEDNPPGPNGPEIARGFRAQFYEEGVLRVDCNSAVADIYDASTYAYIEIIAEDTTYRFKLYFHSKNHDGINNMQPGPLDTAHYDEPYFGLTLDGHSVIEDYIGRYNYPGDSLADGGTASGEIIAVNADSVVGRFRALGIDSLWEIRNCEFNLDYQL